MKRKVLAGALAIAMLALTACSNTNTASTVSTSASSSVGAQNDNSVTTDGNGTTATIDGALVIAEQGTFTAGGTVLTSEGEFDAQEHWTSGGQTHHGNHASVFYQLPADANELSMVFLHGAGQSARSWQTTADGREGFSDIFLRQGYGVYLVDQPRRGAAGQTTVAEEISTTPQDQTWFTQFRIGQWPQFYEGVQFPQDEESSTISSTR